jgi:hypothetical protein
MKPQASIISLRAVRAHKRKAARDVAVLFAASLASGDPESFDEALERLEYNPAGWSPALRAAARMKDIHPASKAMMLAVWVDDGQAIRDSVDNDLLLCDALRNILPPYQGAAQLLYRGEGALARRRRIYGLSWTTDRGAAESFARNNGCVVLETLASPEAIICVSQLFIDNLRHDIEVEYLVDRRRLGAVNVLRRDIRQ